MLRTGVWLWGSTSLLALSCLPLSAQALPAGGNVVAGEAVINPVSENYLEINQSSDRAILHWDSFNLGEGHQVHFNQPSVDAATLNRVTGDTPSNIAGQITAVGNVMLVNPNGILFTETAQIDVGGLLGTSLLVDEVGFMGGQPLSLLAGSGTPGSVINRGQITVRDAGYAALVAPHVANQGVIRARLGRVDLASGSQATIDFYGDGLISLAVDSALVHDPELMALIENGGEIIADGGQIWLSAEAGAAIVDYVINTDGIIQAQQVDNQDGLIVLRGGQGRMRLAGRLEATGGNLDISGTELLVDSEIGIPRGVGAGAADMAVALNLGSETAPGRLDISENGFLRVRELSLDSPLRSSDQTPITIANARADGLHGDQLTLNTRFQLEGYGFNPSPVVNVNPGGSIQAGVNAVDNGGLVNIAPGLFTEGATVTINSRDLTLRGAGPGADSSTNTIVSGEGQYRVFSVNDGSNVTFEQLRIQDGITPTGGGWPNQSGGGIQVQGNSTVTVRDSALVNNRANYGGGAVLNSDSTVTIIRSTLSGNRSDGIGFGAGGGAVFSNIDTNTETNRLTISNSTISGNTTSTDGGGVYVRRGQARIEDSTITENTAERGSGFASRGFPGGNQSNTVTEVSNTIISGNGGDNDVSLVVDGGGNGINTFQSLGHNLIGGGASAGQFNNNDIINSNPGLGPLADNGGPTQTHALLADSPALEAGSTSATTDQRGLPRGETPDIGAFEAQPLLPEEPQPEEPRPEEPRPEEPQPGDPQPDSSQPSDSLDQIRAEAASLLRQGTEEALLLCQNPEALPEILGVEEEEFDLEAWCGISGQNAHYSDQFPRLLPDL